MATSNTNTPQFSKLDGPNYLTWRTQFLAFLKSHDKLGMVDDSIPAPAKALLDGAANPAYEHWSKSDTAILYWLMLHISPCNLRLSISIPAPQSSPMWSPTLTQHPIDFSSIRIPFISPHSINHKNRTFHNYTAFHNLYIQLCYLSQWNTEKR